MEKERPHYNENNQQIVELGKPFRPFEDGFTQDADFELKPIKGAFGYSQVFIIPEIGKGRVEVFTDSQFILKSEIATQYVEEFDEEKYKFHDVLPVIPIPVIYFDDELNGDPNLVCTSQLRNFVIEGRNVGEPGYNDLAIFPMWEDPNLRSIAEYKFYTEKDLKDLTLIFDRYVDDDAKDFYPTY